MIIDNASYHARKENKVPARKTTTRPRTVLGLTKIKYRTLLSAPRQADLSKLVKENKIKVEYTTIEEIALKNNIKT